MVLTFQNIAIHRTDNFSENGSLYFPGIFPYADLKNSQTLWELHSYSKEYDT